MLDAVLFTALIVGCTAVCTVLYTCPRVVDIACDDFAIPEEILLATLYAAPPIVCTAVPVEVMIFAVSFAVAVIAPVT